MGCSLTPLGARPGPRPTLPGGACVEPNRPPLISADFRSPNLRDLGCMSAAVQAGETSKRSNDSFNSAEYEKKKALRSPGSHTITGVFARGRRGMWPLDFLSPRGCSQSPAGPGHWVLRLRTPRPEPYRSWHSPVPYCLAHLRRITIADADGLECTTTLFRSGLCN